MVRKKAIPVKDLDPTKTPVKKAPPTPKTPPNRMPPGRRPQRVVNYDSSDDDSSPASSSRSSRALARNQPSTSRGALARDQPSTSGGALARDQPSTSRALAPSAAPQRVTIGGRQYVNIRGTLHEIVTRKPPDNIYRLPPPPTPDKKRRRAKPGAKVLKEILKLQKTTNLIIPKAPFARLVRDVINMMSRDEKKIAHEALLALQEASEAYLVTVFECMNRTALHARRVTIMPADINLVRWILIAFDKNYFG
ncbi:histone H3 [Aphelenchoides avenae]|nr:histone H3 [Aphelenchus avenae]